MYIKLGFTAVLLGLSVGAMASSCINIKSGCTKTSGRIATLFTGTKSYYCQNGDTLQLDSSTCAGIEALPPDAKPIQQMTREDSKYICKSGHFIMKQPVISPRGSHGNVWVCKSST